jgi:hypothetical protein
MTSEKVFFFSVLRVLRCRRNQMSIDLFPSNGWITVACLHNCYLAMGLHVTMILFHCLHREVEWELSLLPTPWSGDWLYLKWSENCLHCLHHEVGTGLIAYTVKWSENCLHCLHHEVGTGSIAYTVKWSENCLHCLHHEVGTGSIAYTMKWSVDSLHCLCNDVKGMKRLCFATKLISIPPAKFACPPNSEFRSVRRSFRKFNINSRSK